MGDEDFYSDLSHGALLKQMSLAELRTAIDAGTWKANDPAKHANAKEIIRRHEQAAALAAQSKRDAREEETLSIAKSALSIAKDANRIASEDLAVARDNAKSARKSADAAERNSRWALYAAIAAVVAVAIATKDQILALIFGQP